MKKGTNLRTVSVIALVALSLLEGCSRNRQTTNSQEGYDSEAFHSTKNQKVSFKRVQLVLLTQTILIWLS